MRQRRKVHMPLALALAACFLFASLETANVRVLSYLRYGATEEPSIQPFSRKPTRVACFLMTSAKDFDHGLSVRYSIWGRRCAKFVVVTNNPSQKHVERLDADTYVMDISTIIQQQLHRLNYKLSTNSAADAKEHPLTYTAFPPPDLEDKQTLALKTFYSWLAMADFFLNDDIDYFMKVDHDTYVIMDNYLEFLGNNFHPHQHAYIGRVFKADNEYHRPFVSGLAVTLSRRTLQLFHQKATIDLTGANKCAAEEFGVHYRALEDYAMSECLQSLAVYPSNTQDENGQELFMHWDPKMHASTPLNVPEWYSTFSIGGAKETCCSPRACAFHYVARELQNDTLVYNDQDGFWHWQNGKRDSTADHV